MQGNVRKNLPLPLCPWHLLQKLELVRAIMIALCVTISSSYLLRATGAANIKMKMYTGGKNNDAACV
jgi:hypothetical protein